MGVCMGCGGIVGRDCFNPVECLQISQQMQESDEIDYLRGENEYLKQKVEELKSMLVAHGIYIETI